MSSVKCYFTFEITLEKDFTCPHHVHSCTEIVMNKNCSGVVFNGAARVKYSDGYFFTYQPGREHWITNEKAGSQFCVGISGCNSEKIPFGVFKITPEIGNISAKIMMEAKSANLFRNDYLDVLAGQLAIEILRISRKQPPYSDRIPHHADAAKKILDSRFDEQISINELASTLFISSDYLRQLFRETFGESPMHYLIRKRIDYACHLLRNGNSLLSDIAIECGIGNPYYFSRLFRKVTGVPPSAYREKHSGRIGKKSETRRKQEVPVQANA